MAQRAPRKRKPARGPTIHDVARTAGVSTATVSRCLSGPASVREPTRERVERAIASLRYRPNGAARELVCGAPSQLGFVAAELADPMGMTLLRGAAGQARSAGLLLLVAEAKPPGEETGRADAGLRGHASGLVLHAPTADKSQLQELARTTPVVVVGRRVPRMAAVVANETLRLRKALLHLRELGHRDIALVGELPDASGMNEGEAAHWRSEGLRLRQLTTDSASFASGYELGRRLSTGPTTACVVFDDERTRGIIAGLDAAGASVPAVVSVVGAHDGSNPRATRPALTTVSVRLEDMGSAAVELLLMGIQSESPSGGLRTVRFDPRLAIRGSTGPVRQPTGSDT